MADQTKYTNKLANSRILVLGGTSGIGYATAECLLEHGAGSIILSSSSSARVADKVKQLQAAYPSKASRVSGFACNLAEQATLESEVKKLLDQATNNGQHKLDHIVHTAGNPINISPVKDVDLDATIKGGMVRYFSAIILCKHAPAYMNPGPASSITLTTGQAGERPMPGWSVVVGYATGLQGLTRGMALDLAPLRVVLVSPGAVDTELWTNMGMTEEMKQGMIAKFVEGMATGQVGKASDVAETYLYAIKDHNLTGVMISTNGGGLLKGPS